MLGEFDNISIDYISTTIPTNSNFKILNNFSNKKINQIQRTLKMIGVQNSYYADTKTTTLDLCINSAKYIINKNKIDTKTIGLVIFVTQTPDYLMPSSSNISIQKLNLDDATIGFDINLGCSGYVYGLWVISNLLKTIKSKKALLLVGDTVSKTIKSSDLSHKLLFGDAGSATLISKVSSKNNTKSFFDIGSSKKGFDKLMFKNSGFRGNLFKPEFYMEGKEVFLFAISSIPNISKKLLDFSKLKEKNIKYYIFHQANLFMLEKIFDSLKIPKNKILNSIIEYGNTSSASIPTTLCNNYQKFNKIKSYVMFSGFGAGFSYANLIFKLSNTKIYPILSYENKKRS